MLPPGNYSVIVTDSGVGLLNQVVTANATMTPTIPTIGISGVITNATGPNYNNGAINVTVTPTDTYTYQWSTGQTTEDIANQTAGVRTITVKNPYQCKATKSFTIQKKLIILNPTQ